MLTTFNRRNVPNCVDLGEKIGNISLGLLRIGFGKTVTVEKMSSGGDKIAFTQKEYSTCVRVSVVALFVIAFPVTIVVASVGCVAITYSKSHGQMLSLYNQSNKEQKERLSITDLWLRLRERTCNELQALEYFSVGEVNHRFSDIFCPKKTSLLNLGYYLHANKVGEGVTQSSFIASQAPLEGDYEAFWQAVFESGSTIFDLTTVDDQRSGGVTKYYPEKLNQIIIYGSCSVKLIQIDGQRSTYEIRDKHTGVVKNINRFHYPDWKDFGAVSLSILELLIKEVKTLSPNPKNWVWIHCRAGVGRTGTLITALILREKITCGQINKENLDESLMNIIIKLRKQRGPNFVQQQIQLDLLRQYANSLLS